ncbi:MAG: ABC transporter substrate-binding protein [Burkholderiales bacterium]|nr:ABC transporter substrate-binding protein [Burkholderiales bacterium]
MKSARRRQQRWLGSALAGTLSLCAGVFGAAAGAKDIVIAQVAPFSGVQASAGKSYAAGLRLAFAAVNAAGGINGNQIRLVTADDGYKPEDTVRLAKEIIAKESPVALAATVGTANADALIKANVLTDNGIALVGPSSGASSVIGKPGVFVTKASYADEVNQLLTTLSSMGLSRVAVVYQDDGYGKDLLDAATALATKYKIELVARTPYDRITGDIAPAVNALLKVDAQVIFLAAISAPAANFIRTYKQRGGTAMLIGPSPVDLSYLQKNVPKELLRGYVASTVGPIESRLTLPVIREYLKQKAANPSPDYGVRSFEGYVSGRVLIAALQRSKNSPESLAQALRGLRALDLGGYTVDFSDLKRGGSNYVDFVTIDRSGSLVR